MKTAAALTTAIVAWTLLYGAPFADELPVSRHYYGSAARILPMSFAHVDHVTIGCSECHHNYVDDTGLEPCMYCHVSNADVRPLLEEQFHTLCRGCHADLAANGEAGGPPRQCIACHLGDELP
jgi:predicted CXXCH cytochrome family protein